MAFLENCNEINGSTHIELWCFIECAANRYWLTLIHRPFLSNHFWIRCLKKVLLYWLQVSLKPDCKNLGSGVPILMAADKPRPQLQPSLEMIDYNWGKNTNYYEIHTFHWKLAANQGRSSQLLCISEFWSVFVTLLKNSYVVCKIPTGKVENPPKLQ